MNPLEAAMDADRHQQILAKSYAADHTLNGRPRPRCERRPGDYEAELPIPRRRASGIDRANKAAANKEDVTRCPYGPPLPSLPVRLTVGFEMLAMCGDRKF